MRENNGYCFKQNMNNCIHLMIFNDFYEIQWEYCSLFLMWFSNRIGVCWILKFEKENNVWVLIISMQ